MYFNTLTFLAASFGKSSHRFSPLLAHNMHQFIMFWIPCIPLSVPNFEGEHDSLGFWRSASKIDDDFHQSRNPNLRKVPRVNMHDARRYCTELHPSASFVVFIGKCNL